MRDRGRPLRATDEIRGAAEDAVSDQADVRKATADFVADMSGQLATMARGSGLEALARILDMARMEAEDAEDRLSGPDSE